jgi:transcriptional regulator with XRE-family HTH domain
MYASELREIRRRLGFTQQEMGTYVGIHSNSIARMERGELTITEPVARLVQLIAVGAKAQSNKEDLMKQRKPRLQQFMDKYQISEQAARAWLSTIGKANSRARWRNRTQSIKRFTR